MNVVGHDHHRVKLEAFAVPMATGVEDGLLFLKRECAALRFEGDEICFSATLPVGETAFLGLES